eukprot:2405957-Amphidinium_carterae.1
MKGGIKENVNRALSSAVLHMCVDKKTSINQSFCTWFILYLLEAPMSWELHCQRTTKTTTSYQDLGARVWMMLVSCGREQPIMLRCIASCIRRLSGADDDKPQSGESEELPGQ